MTPAFLLALVLPAQPPVADGLRVERWAAEPMVANPVTFCFDDRGRVYVAETFRLHDGVTDNRRHMDWLEDDLACRTVEDRIAMYRAHLGEGFDAYRRAEERVRRLEDRDGDGRADSAQVFAGGFRDAADGLGAGLLAHGRDVYYACIPRLWRLRDEDGDGTADRREVLSEGYGVHTSLLGHDLHGLILGPDGRLWFSIGDRGLHVRTREGRVLSYPDTGAVLRCELDGSDLEVFATGLRNPQELAFDDHGNLFTADNNSDGGDRARLVLVVEGGDSGWRIGYQYLADRGPWNREKLWHTHFPGQAAWIVPPIGHVGSGPSGLVFDPGVGLPPRLAGRLLLCDFRGTAARSGVWALAVAPRGAGFVLRDAFQPIRRVLATDVDVGPDGAIWISDWITGWEQTGKGRIWRVFPPAVENDPEVARVKRLLAEGMRGRASQELAALLGHRDRRVRLRAQFALAARGVAEVPRLAAVAAQAGAGLARLHAIWALGQIARRDRRALPPLRRLLDDADAEVRAQIARVLGDVRDTAAGPALTALVDDPAARVRFFAAIALGRLGHHAATPMLLGLLRKNDDTDPFLRHAAVMGLTGAAPDAALREAAGDASPAVRLGVLLAMRRRRMAELSRFLEDPSPRLVLEAARAIYDTDLAAAMPALAACLRRTDPGPRPLVRRAIAACAQIGEVATLAAFAARDKANAALRVLALDTLGEMASPRRLDPVSGCHRPRPATPRADLRQALGEVFDTLWAAESPQVRAAAARAAGRVPLRRAAERLRAAVAAGSEPGGVRRAAFEALEALDDPSLGELAERLVEDHDAAVRAAALRSLARTRPARAAPLLARMAERGPIPERRKALQAIARLRHPAGEKILLEWIDRLQAGRVPPSLQLDVVDAAVRRKSARLNERIVAYALSLPRNDPLREYRMCLQGGDRDAGRRIFWQHEAAACKRCHAIAGSGGDAGPDLGDVGSRLSREQLLEALLLPSRRVVPGYGTVAVTTDEGRVLSGILLEDTPKRLVLRDEHGRRLEIPRARIAARTGPVSAMPPMQNTLSRAEIRDLIEFLAGLRGGTTRREARRLERKNK